MLTFVFGILAGIGSAISFGSFGVPIKCKQIMDAKVHPFVYQCYKSSVCFVTSFIVLAWNPFRFTWWGTVGAAIWVLNGVCAIMAIQKCGLGIAQTTYSALSIFVAFIWGAFIFHEDIKSLPMAVVGLLLMALGFAGLGYAAQRALVMAKKVAPTDEAAAVEAAKLESIVGKVVDTPLITEPSSSVRDVSRDDIKGSKAEKGYGKENVVQNGDGHAVHGATNGHREVEDVENGDLVDKTVPGAAAVNQKGKWDYMIGVGLACFIGLLNGSLSVPFKYAQKEVKGIVYILSFGIGVAIITSGAAICFFGLLAACRRKLPRFQVRVASGPACLTGLLWSIGNFLSIYAVQYCGLSLGWPLVQCQLVVSSTWALLYYKEMPGWISILMFVGSVAVILVGVFILAFFGTGSSAGSH